MIKAFLAILFVLVCAAFASAQQLPDDSSQYHLVVVTAPVPTASCQGLIDQTHSHPTLSKIRQASKSFEFAADDTLYQARYAITLGDTDLPKIALVRSDGGVLYKASGSAMPGPDQLAADLMQAASADRAQHPRAVSPNVATDCPTCPNQPRPAPDRNPIWRPGERPSLIPDTVNVNTDIAIPNFVYFIAAAFGILLIGGMSLVAILGLGIGITILARSFS